MPGFYRFWVGDFEVTALLDGYTTLPTGFINGYDETLARSASSRAYKPFSPVGIPVPINGYVVNTGRQLVLIDAGSPKAAGAGMGNLTSNLKAAGIDPDAIDVVLFTHLHIDHVGELSDAAGNRTFTNATLMTAEAEWEFTHDDAVYRALPENFRPYVDISRQIVAPYASERQVFTGEVDVVPGITSIPLPGHTPGHTGFALHSNNESLLIWGDIVHLSGLQFAYPDWGVVFDADPELAKRTRRAMFDRASTDRMAVAGMHIDFPGIGYIERTQQAFRYVSAPWQTAR
ncbi:MBL fold metallo-hydrolase [Cohaesibacter sp. CAU 1516]|uniref:MBL fold metallo-hydrolase n=1 Tax=Cohaesibacter sp. CAU 1516 TaxID=2576038 RepID=UPI001AEDEA7E|nr:MBL fold metallo-hydrolase [Cohaesibacter sp. CAU 1516]